jgi:hypothetical protein
MSSSFDLMLALKLAKAFSPRSIEGDYKKLGGIMNQLKGLNGSGHWIFLQTHGMWTCEIEGDLTLEIDPKGETTLHLIHKDYELIKAIENIPLFHFMVDRLAVHKEEKEKTSDVSPWGIHVRIKRGELATLLDQGIEVSPLTFFAATSGFHRLARSFRFQAVQSALSKKIAKALFGDDISASNCKAFHELYGVRDEYEVLSAFAALASGNVRISQMSLKVVEAELTTARERIRNACIYKCLLEFMLHRKRLDVDVRASGGELQLSPSGKDDEDSEKLSDMLRAISQDVLGRLEAYRRAFEELEKELKNGPFNGELCMAVGFSEQMGPCDFFLLASLLDRLNKLNELNIEIKTTYVLATSLSYPMAALSSLYAALELGKPKMLGDVEFVLASEDVAVSKVLAKHLEEKTKGGKLIYLASGPTSQVLTLCIELKRLMKERAILIPLAPLPATARATTAQA